MMSSVTNLLLLLIISMCKNKLFLSENEKGNYMIETEETSMSNLYIYDKNEDYALGIPKMHCQNENVVLNDRIKRLEAIITNLKKGKNKIGKQEKIAGKNNY